MTWHLVFLIALTFWCIYLFARVQRLEVQLRQAHDEIDHWRQAWVDTCNSYLRVKHQRDALQHLHPTTEITDDPH